MDDFEDIYASSREPNAESTQNTAVNPTKPQESIETPNEKPSQPPHELKESKSIYDLGSPITESTEQQPIDITANYTFSTSDKKLSYIGNDSVAIPTEIIYQFGLKTLILDISFNSISDLRDLHQFPYLDELICDNNEISENTDFPKLDSLKILSCNKNKIDDIHVFIDKVKVQFPNLTYLSLLGNRACPNQLIDPNKDEYDYSRYRKYVLYRMKKLKFLDCYEVTKEERQMIADDSLFLDVVTLDEKSNGNSRRKEEENASDNYTPLTQVDTNKYDKQDAKDMFIMANSQKEIDLFEMMICE